MFTSKLFVLVFISSNYFYVINCVPKGIQFHDCLYDFEDKPKSELQLVQVVFRHGNRTPEPIELELYPNSPYINETFQPYGLKALTNGGKMRAYNIGLYLRRHYDGFLSEEYLPEEIYVRTTDFDRTKMSALACLAGLYPPPPSQVWNPEIMWQPIPYNAVPYNDDEMIRYYSCPRYLLKKLNYSNSAEFQKLLKPYTYLFNKISPYVGRNITTSSEVFYLDNLFQAEQSYGLKIPQWAQAMMSEIKKVTDLEYKSQFATDELMQIAGGQMLNKIIRDAQMKINGTLTPSGRKMFVYSGHEVNVAAMLACSGVFEPHQPPYGSTFILELHKMLPKGNYAFRLIYIKDIMGKSKVLPIPNCGEFCDINKFIDLTKKRVIKSFKDVCE